MAANPSPSVAPGTLNPFLSAMLEFDYMMDRGGFIGYRVAPVIEVALAADTPGKVPVEELLRDVDVTRAAGGGYTRGTMRFGKWSYSTQEYGYEEVVDERLKRIYANILEAEAIQTQRARDVILREDEKRKASLLYDTSVWTGAPLTTAVGTEWSNIASTPVSDVKAAKLKIFGATGLWPNSLIINYTQFMNLRENTSIINRIESAGSGDATKAADITAQQLAQVFDLDQVIVAGAARNTSNQAHAAAMSQIWSSEYAMVARVATSNDVAEPCVARSFHWAADGSQILGAVEEYMEDRVRGKVIRVRHEVDEVVMYPEAAHLLSNITA